MSSENNETRKRILEVTWKLLEEGAGTEVTMSKIAKAAGISRQAVYLHFASRSELIIATVNYVDELKGLYGRLEQIEQADSGVKKLGLCIEIWANHVPEIYGLAKAMYGMRDSDEDMAEAWKTSMGCLRDVCADAIASIEHEGRLAGDWSADDATDFFMAMISIANWEQLVRECGWSTFQFIERIRDLLVATFVAEP